jgi:aconitate hydratase
MIDEGAAPMTTLSLDSFKCRATLDVGSKTYTYFSLPEAEKNGLAGISRLPFSLKVLLENLLRFEDGKTVSADDIRAVAAWLDKRSSDREIAYRPARVLMQDFTGVPAVVDLAAMRDATAHLGSDPKRINPQVPVDLVIDHSVMVDFFGSSNAFEKNVDMEYERNGERYTFLRWGQEAFENFRVVPPGTGICHQVNLEYLAQTVWTREEQESGATVTYAFPDTLVGTDSHTTMVNGLSVLGWGVGGIEAEAAMLGQPISMLVPEVIGFRVAGKLPEGTTATDLVLTVTQMLRAKGVVGKFVEFYGPGLSNLSLEDQATIGNMAPEYGATCGFFPIDNDTIAYLTATGREPQRVALVEAYAKAQGMWRSDDTPDPVFTDTLELDLGDVVPSLAGPKRPQDRVPLDQAAAAFAKAHAEIRGGRKDPDAPAESTGESRFVDEGAEGFDTNADGHRVGGYPVDGETFHIADGDVVIAAITSCTNTSNPSVLIGAGLLAKKAHEKGLKPKPWVKTSLAPGSQVVTEYLAKAGLQEHLDALGFNLVGYGCTTCIGNSGPLADSISKAINDNDLVACSVLSGNRNFEGRVNPDVRANYLASPPLVVAYALAGSMRVDITRRPLGEDKDGQPVYLKDLWPSSAEIAGLIREVISQEMFRTRYGDVFRGDEHWHRIQVEGGLTYKWSDSSTYVQNPPYFTDMKPEPEPATDIVGARILGLFLDSITTDHISPAGSIKRDGPAGEYLISHQVRPLEFNSYGSRRGNHQVMMRGTFANIRIKNQMVPGVEGGVTVHHPSGEQMSIYDAAMRYQQEGVPLVVFAGKEYGTGSSRDWAAKGTRLLGVRAVIAQSFERIHRSNLVGMGVLPLVFEEGTSWQSLGLKGDETVAISGIADLTPRQTVTAEITSADGAAQEVPLLVRIDTLDELEYFRNGGILHYVLRNLVKEAA